MADFRYAQCQAAWPELQLIYQGDYGDQEE